MRIKVLILLITTLFLTSCVEKFMPELDKYENLLVVDGMITNEAGPYTIRLSTSTAINTPGFKPYIGATVTITDNLGNSETLIETIPGNYSTSYNGMQGVIGRKYKISISTQDGDIYESDYEQMYGLAQIDSIYAEVEYHHNSLNEELSGCQFYINSNISGSESKYLLWKLQETYEFNSDFLIDYIYSNYNMYQVLNSDTLFKCWRTENIYEIFTYTTEHLQQQNLHKIPLNYISSETKRLTILYSLLVEQYSITEKAYHFWNSLQKQNSGQGSLYSQQPYQIRGNIYNVNNSEEPVLGYFGVASVTKKRIFVPRPPDINFVYPKCELDYEGMVFLFATPESQWPVYMAIGPDGNVGLASDGCFDCTLRGGSLLKPPFWPNK